jgi:hypothetical protein
LDFSYEIRAIRTHEERLGGGEAATGQVGYPRLQAGTEATTLAASKAASETARASAEELRELVEGRTLEGLHELARAGESPEQSRHPHITGRYVGSGIGRRILPRGTSHPSRYLPFDYGHNRIRA